jgi:hypothetical protein
MVSKLTRSLELAAGVDVKSFKDDCDAYWWSTLLYINNGYPAGKWMF